MSPTRRQFFSLMAGGAAALATLPTTQATERIDMEVVDISGLVAFYDRINDRELFGRIVIKQGGGISTVGLSLPGKEHEPQRTCQIHSDAQEVTAYLGKVIGEMRALNDAWHID